MATDKEKPANLATNPSSARWAWIAVVVAIVATAFAVFEIATSQ